MTILTTARLTLKPVATTDFADFADFQWDARIEVKVDVAACIKNGLWGLVPLMFTYAAVTRSDTAPLNPFA